ncbi:MAG: PLP-dependent aminotransferase family protein [Pseudodonghicola sp.]
MNTIWADTLATATGPKYRAVADRIRRAVQTGELSAGEKLPPVRELAYQLEITPGTVARAYTLLTDEGVLQAEVGRGTFVSPPQAPLAPLMDDVWSRSISAEKPGQEASLNLFAPRLPDVGQVAAIRQALRQAAEVCDDLLLDYPRRDSYRPVRQAVVDWLSDQRLGPLGEQDVVLTHGGQNAILTVYQAVLTGPQPVVLVEELSYAGFRRAAELTRATVEGVQMDAHGMIPEALDSAARRTGAQLICVSPEVHNPTCTHMPLERRRALIAVARRHGLQIVEDECYRMGAAHAPSLRSLAPDITWHVTSISKQITPALRVGFALAPLDQAVNLRRVAEYAYFGLSQPQAEVARLLLSNPRTRELADLARARLADYVRITVNALGSYDLNWNAAVPFVWLRLPAGWRAAAFCRAAEREGIQIRSADEFALRDGRAPHAVRIAMNGQVPLERFGEAMQQLRRLLDNPPELIAV